MHLNSEMMKFFNVQGSSRACSLLLYVSVFVFLLGVGCKKAQITSYYVSKKNLTISCPDGFDNWEVPKGWMGSLSVKPVVATFRVYDSFFDGNETEKSLGGAAIITVTNFDGTAGELGQNVARWAGQLGIKPPDEDEIAKTVSPIEINGYSGQRVQLQNSNDGRALLVDWVEVQGSAWFIKIMGNITVVEKSIPALDAFSQSIRFNQDLPSGLESWRVPPRWVKGRSRTLVLRSFVLSGEKAEVEVTISRARGALEANLARWAQIMQLELPEDPVKEWVQSCDVDGRAAHLIHMHSPDTANRMIVVMVPSGEADESWFFRLKGNDVEAVLKEGEFKTFVDSIRFSEDGKKN